MQQSARCVPITQSKHRLRWWGSLQQKLPMTWPAGVATWAHLNPTGQVASVSLMWGWKCLWANLVDCAWGERRDTCPAGGQESGGCWGSTAGASSATLNPPETFLEPLQAPLWMLQYLCSGKGLWRSLSNWEVWISELPCLYFSSSWVQVA